MIAELDRNMIPNANEQTYFGNETCHLAYTYKLSINSSKESMK